MLRGPKLPGPRLAAAAVPGWTTLPGYRSAEKTLKNGADKNIYLFRKECCF